MGWRSDASEISAQTQRHEWKYLIDKELASKVRVWLKKHAEYDAYSGAGGHYHVRTLYIASAETAAAPIIKKHKLRLREYVADKGDAVYFLEVKSREGDHIGKLRMRLYKDGLHGIAMTQEAILSAVLDRLDSESRMQVLGGMLARPVTVEYMRQAWDLHGPSGMAWESLRPQVVRVTIDENVTAYFSDDVTNRVQVCPRNLAILEVKHGTAIPYILKFLSELGLKSTGFSKVKKAQRMFDVSERVLVDLP